MTVKESPGFKQQIVKPPQTLCDISSFAPPVACMLLSTRGNFFSITEHQPSTSLQ